MLKKSIKDIAVLAECFNIDIRSLSKEWLRIYLHRLRFRGKKDAVKFCKELNTVAERYALHRAIEPIPWTKSDNDGFPRILKRFKKHLRSENNMEVVFTLTVFRTVELLRLPISKDISSVTQPSTADNAYVVDIIKFIPYWVERIPALTLKSMIYHVTVKSGPNGHALQRSGSDQMALMNTPKLLGAIQVVQDKLKDQDPMDLNEITICDKIPIHSKLTQFPEKAGKTRTIAIVDYYSQRCLRPLHKGIMRILNALISDGTYSHSSVGKYAEQLTKEKSFIACADLTTATDRFPAVIQQYLLYYLVKDNDLAAAFWTLLAERTFTVAWSGEQVVYACGQPMGCYASWPLFALAHHLIVEYSAYQAYVDNAKSKYRLIGDDVIISDEKLWISYERVMKALGLTINAGKTVISPEADVNTAAEVAKQLYLNGRCITPLTPGFIKLLRKPHMFNTCMGILKNRYGDTFSSDLPPMLIERLFYKKKTQKLVWTLVSNPISGYIKPADAGYDDNSPWGAFNAESIDIYKEMLIDILVDKAVSETLKNLQYTAGRGSPWVGLTQPQPHALRNAYKGMMKALKESTNRLRELLFSGQIDLALAEVPYVPKPETPYLTTQELKQKKVSSLILTLYKQVLDLESSKIES